MCLVGMRVKWEGMLCGEGALRANADIREEELIQSACIERTVYRTVQREERC